MIKRALISVADKSGLAEFAAGLAAMGVEIVSTGGTARALRAGRRCRSPTSAGSPASRSCWAAASRPCTRPSTPASCLAAHPRTLAELSAHGIAAIDLVVVNLYPFREAVARPGCTLDEAVEEIDIGGVTLLRAAAKNYRPRGCGGGPGRVSAPCSQEMREHGGALTAATRARLAVAAFAHTAAYDAAISAYLVGQATRRQRRPFPPTWSCWPRTRRASCATARTRTSGPHSTGTGAAGVACGRLLQGKELSFNNLLDLDAAWDAVQRPCRRRPPSSSSTPPPAAPPARPPWPPPTSWPTRATRLSAFGGILACKQPGGRRHRRRHRQALPGVHRRPGLRPPRRWRSWPQDGLPAAGGGGGRGGGLGLAADQRRPAAAGRDAADQAEWRVVTRACADGRGVGLAALRLGPWCATSSPTPSALAARDRGAGRAWAGGQTSRVDAVHMAVRKAGDRARGAVLASDAFFPFRDGVDLAAEAGVSRPSCSPAAPSVTRRPSPPPTRPAWPWSSPAFATFATEPADRQADRESQRSWVA